MESDYKQKIQEMTVDELMDVAKQKLSKPIKRQKKIKEKFSTIDQVKEFTLGCQIKSHQSLKVLALVVYDRYVNWATNNNEDRIMSFTLFSREFGKLFKSVTVREKFFLISPEGFNISDTHYEFIRQKYKKTKKSN